MYGLAMEMEDSSYQQLKDFEICLDPKDAFRDCDYALLVGAFPRAAGMERGDLLGKNAGIFKEHGQAIKEVADPDCKCLIVGNPVNTNSLLVRMFSDDEDGGKRFNPNNITGLTRLDQNRCVVVGQWTKEHIATLTKGLHHGLRPFSAKNPTLQRRIIYIDLFAKFMIPPLHSPKTDF